MTVPLPHPATVDGTPSALACAEACREAVIRGGGGFMTGRAVTETATDLELTFLEFYFAGRCGVLGPAPGPVMASALTFFEPDYAARHWTSALNRVRPEEAADRYLEACRDTGRHRWAGRHDLARPVELVARVVRAADCAALPLAAGWAALPPAADEAGYLAQLLQVLREHRGGLHALATRACGLSPLETIVAGPDGPERAALLGWRGPLPPLTDGLRTAHARAEQLTDRLAADAYAILSAAERAELVTWCTDLTAQAGKG